MIWLCIVTLFSFILKGLCGFANSMVFTTLLSFSNSIVHISPINLLLNFPSNFIMVWNGRKFLDKRIYLPLCIMMVAGLIPGTLFFKNTDISVLEITFGLVVVIIALDMMLRKRKPAPIGQKIDWKMGILGICAGFLAGFCGIGVLVGAYINKVTDDMRIFKANACFVYLVSDILKTTMFILLSIITKDILLSTLSLVPFAFGGLWLGIKSSSILKEATVKKVVMVMLLLSGLALVITNL